MNRIFLFTILTAFAAINLKSADVGRGPYVEAAGMKSAVIKWSFDKPSMSWLQYGPKPACDRMMTISPVKLNHTIYLYGLAPGTDYCYRLFTNMGENASVRVAQGSFKTLKQTSKTVFEFLIVGETASVDRQQYEIARLMEQFNPDFVIHTGNIVSTGLNEDADRQYFEPFKNLMLKAPFFLAMGVDSYGTDAKSSESKNFVKKNYKTRHTMTWSEATPHYYYFDNANARFIFLDAASVLDVKHAPSIDSDSRQIAWLKRALSRSRGLWKFVFINIPVYSTGNEGSSKKLIKILEHIFESYGADIVFQGYDTNYERTHQIKDGKKVDRGGIIYVTLGGGGKPLKEQENKKGWSRIFKDEYHFARVQVHGRKVTMTVYDLQEKVMDKFQVIR